MAPSHPDPSTVAQPPPPAPPEQRPIERPPTGPTTIGAAPAPADPAPTDSAADGLPLPHERDQGRAAVNPQPQPVIEQAKRDLDAGLVDTDMRATPGLDALARQRLVPGAGGQR